MTTDFFSIEETPTYKRLNIDAIKSAKNFSDLSDLLSGLDEKSLNELTLLELEKLKNFLAEATAQIVSEVLLNKCLEEVADEKSGKYD